MHENSLYTYRLKYTLIDKVNTLIVGKNPLLEFWNEVNIKICEMKRLKKDN